MKTLYWRESGVSLKALWLVALLALGGLWLVEGWRIEERQPDYVEKLAAATRASRAFAVLKAERLARGLAIERETDPSESGLIGALLTPVTTNPGQLAAKQTSINPNFAAVFVELLREAGIGRGDVVAVGLSGSFPALNVALLAALETLGAKGLVISSAGSSQWGANLEGFMWPEMERLLVTRRMLTTRSLALTRGGIEDHALGLPKAGRRLLDEALERAGAPILDIRSYADSVEARMALYREHAKDAPIRAYVNVGGGTTSVGTRLGKYQFKPGLNLEPPPKALRVDSVMTRFAAQGVPVIHITRIAELARRYGLPSQPVRMPKVGQGEVFSRETESRPLAAFVLVAILVALTLLVRLNLGYRLLARPSDKEANDPPRPAV